MFLETVVDFGRVGLGEFDPVGLFFARFQFQKPIGHGVAAFVLGIEGVFSGGHVAEDKLPVGGRPGPEGGGVGGGLAKGIEIEVFVAVGKIDCTPTGFSSPSGLRVTARPSVRQVSIRSRRISGMRLVGARTISIPPRSER